MTPEQEAQDRLRRAIVDDEFPDAEQVEQSPFAAVIPDPLAFERNAAVSAWMSQASGRNVDAGTPTWQAEKDALARGFFKMPTAKGITDSEIHGLVRQHVMTSEEAVMDGINAALAGRPLLESVSAFEAKGGASKLRAKWPEYSQEMRKYYDATEARVAPYRDLIQSSAAQLGKEMETGLPATDAFKAVADQLLEIPEADRRIVIKAMAATGGDTPDAQRSYLGKLGAAFGRMSEGLGSSVESGVSDLIYSMAASGGIEQVNPEAAGALRQQGQTTRSYYQLANMVRKVADSDISPIEAEGFLAETGIGLARMGPLLASSAVPYAGVATMASFYRDDVAANLMLEYEGLDAANADKIALVAAPGIAALEHASNLLPFGKIPGVGSFLKSSITSIKAGIIRGGTLIAAGTGGEIAEEVFQEIAPKLVQDLFAEVDKEVPGVNWTDEKKKLEKIPAQVFGPALAVSLIGGGVVSVNAVKHGRAISSDRDTLIASGYAPSMADDIALKSKEGDWAGVDALMRSAYDRKKGGISGATEQERKAAIESIQAKILLQQSAIDTLRNNGDLARMANIGGKWVVTRPDGSAPVAFDNPDDANALVWQDAKERNLRVQAVYRDIISQANRDLQEGQELAFVFSPEKMDAKYAVQIGLVSAEAVEGRKKQLAALDEGKLEDQDFTRAEKEAQAEGDTDAVYTILGMNNIENREGVSRGVIRLFQGANFTDLIEEISEVSLKRHLISGEAKRPSMLASLRQAESAIQAAEQAAGLEPTLLFRTKDDAQISDGDLIEAFSHLAKSYYINAIEDGKTSQNWRLKNRNVTRHLRALRSALANTEIFKWLKAMGEKLGTIYKRAAMVQEAQKAGELDSGLEQLIRRSVGLDTQDQMEAGILQEAQGIVEEAGMSIAAPSMSLSKGDQSLEQRLAAMFDPFQKNPEQRRKLGLMAKERVAKVAREYLEETAKPGMIKRKLDEMEADRQKKLAKVTDKTPDWVKAQLEKPVTEAQAKAEISRDRLLGWLRALNAAASVLPVEIRGKLLAGGSIKIASLKTNEARLRAIETLIERADTMLEKWLHKEFTTSIEKLFDRYRPTREAGQKPKGKLSPDEQILMDAAEAAMTLDPVALQAEIAKAEAVASNPDATDEQQVEAERLRDLLQLTGDWKNADAERMSAAYDAVRSVAEKGWAKWKLAELMKRAERQEMRDSLVKDTGKTGVRGERVAMRKQGETNAGKSLKVLLNLSSFQEIMDFAFGKDSKISKYFQDKERAADNQREDAMQDLDDRVSQFFTTQAGGIQKGETLRYELSLPTIQTTEESGEFSQLEAITAILMWQQEDGKRHMMGRMDESGKPSGKWHYNQAFVDTLNAGLDENGRALLSFLRNEYDAEYESLNALYKERHGVSLPKHQFYSPIVVAPQQAKAGEVVDPLTGSSTSSSILTPGFLRSRSFNAVAEPNFRDALQVFIAHKKMLAHWAAYYDLAVEMQSIINNREVQNAVSAKAGEQASLALRRYLDVFAQGGIRDAAAGLEMVEFQKRMIGRASQVALFGRLSVLLVQSTQLAAASVKMPTGAYLVRLSKLMSGNLAWGDAINSPYIQRRMKVMTPLLRQAMADLATIGKPNQIKHAAQKVGQLINGADGLFTAGTYAILLDWHKAQARKLGMTDESEINAFANQNAERDTETVAQPTRSSTRSLAELTATHPLTRAIYSFVSEPRQKLAMLAWAAYQGANRTGAKGAAGKALSLATDPQAAKVAFLTFVVGGLGVQVIKNLWRDAKGDDDEKKWSVQRMTLAMLSSPLSSVPGFAAFTDTGGNLFSSGKRLVPALEDLVTEDQDAVQIMQDVDTVLSVAGLFSDNAAAMSAMTHIAVDAAKVLKNLQDEDD